MSSQSATARLNINPYENAVFSGMYEADLTFKTQLQLSFGSLRIKSSDIDLIDALENEFSPYRSRGTSAENSAFELNIYNIKNLPISEFFELGVLRERCEESSYFLWEKGRGAIFYGHILLLINDNDKSASIIISEAEAGQQAPYSKLVRYDPESQYELDWTLVVEITKGLYSVLSDSLCLHAALVSYKSQGVLLVGNSGSGKTTTSTALMRDGFTFHTDDLSLIKIAKDTSVHAAGLLMKPRLLSESVYGIEKLERNLSIDTENKIAVEIPDHLLSEESFSTVNPKLILLMRTPASTRNYSHSFEEVTSPQRVTELMQQVIDPLCFFRRELHFEIICRLFDSCKIGFFTPGLDLKSLPEFTLTLLEQ